MAPSLVLQFISFGRSEIIVFMEVLFGSLWLYSSSFSRVLKRVLLLGRMVFMVLFNVLFVCLSPGCGVSLLFINFVVFLSFSCPFNVWNTSWFLLVLVLVPEMWGCFGYLWVVLSNYLFYECCSLFCLDLRL